MELLKPNPIMDGEELHAPFSLKAHPAQKKKPWAAAGRCRNCVLTNSKMTQATDILDFSKHFPVKFLRCK
ncbi:unnamed protein product [Nesidiocoris tenuis]|uniref:Uncharacterized protein n=1 Tax=Nesidiocoris tenuis TaxID=355587 RepID=A0A6H5GXU2_9HEMI|nr:unnamed protein product [Nesidiocoris tenuis]